MKPKGKMAWGGGQRSADASGEELFLSSIKNNLVQSEQNQEVRSTGAPLSPGLGRINLDLYSQLFSDYVKILPPACFPPYLTMKRRPNAGLLSRPSHASSAVFQQCINQSYIRGDIWGWMNLSFSKWQESQQVEDADHHFYKG